jgi:hypothetical protein
MAWVLVCPQSATVAKKTEDTPGAPSPGISTKQDAWGRTLHSPSLLELKIREVIRAVDQDQDEHLARARHAPIGLPHVGISVGRRVIVSPLLPAVSAGMAAPIGASLLQSTCVTVG